MGVNNKAIKIEEDFPGAARLSRSVGGRHDQEERVRRVGFAGGRLPGFGQAGPTPSKTGGFHITVPAGFPNNTEDLSFARCRRTAESYKCQACTPRSERWCRARPCRI